MADLRVSIVLAAGLVTSMSASATEIRVMSGGAPKEVFALLTPKFEQQTGHKATLVYEVITALRDKLAAGEKADVLVMPVPMLDGYAKDGKVRADACAIFGSVGISVVVKEGALRPDISSKEKFREAMLAARSVVHATPGKTPSGTHMGKVMEQLGIADAMAKKVVHKPVIVVKEMDRSSLALLGAYTSHQHFPEIDIVLTSLGGEPTVRYKLTDATIISVRAGDTGGGTHEAFEQVRIGYTKIEIQQ